MVTKPEGRGMKVQEQRARSALTDLSCVSVLCPDGCTESVQNRIRLPADGNRKKPHSAWECGFLDRHAAVV